jgi:predicted methyltransferase
MAPLLTLKVHETLRAAVPRTSDPVPQPTRVVQCSLDLERSTTRVEVGSDYWVHDEKTYPFLDTCKDRTVYYWTGSAFLPAARYTQSLIKLVPTEWGPPTFEIDGIKMLPTARVSPFIDAERKVSLIRPKGSVILDTCGGLGYFAAWCLQGGAAQVHSYEKNPDVIWLRSINPWSPQSGVPRLTLENADVGEAIVGLADRSFDAVLHDPPRFGIAGELYSQAFYDQLARVLKPRGMLFHYTGTPNKLTSGRDVPREVLKRLRQAGFAAELHGDGVLARRSFYSVTLKGSHVNELRFDSPFAAPKM